MKRGARPGYVLRQSWLLLEQSPWLTAVSALTVALALTLVGLFAMVLFNANRLLHELGKQMTVSVYLHDQATQADVDALTRTVRARPGVKAVRTLSAEQDRARNKKLLDPKLLDGLDETAIPGQPVLEVELQEELGSRGDVEQLVAWTQSLKSVAAVDSAEFGADKLRVLFAGVEIARTVGLVLSIVLLASAMFFVFSTIRLAVFSRRDEIEVLSLVGATPGFIRLPFLVEGALQGLAGAVLAMGLLGVLHLELRGLLQDVYRLNVQTLLPPGMVAWLFLGGPAVGVAASAVSVGRYLRR
jgi:cell division transport system permease protein